MSPAQAAARRPPPREVRTGSSTRPGDCVPASSSTFIVCLAPDDGSCDGEGGVCRRSCRERGGPGAHLDGAFEGSATTYGGRSECAATTSRSGIVVSSGMHSSGAVRLRRRRHSCSRSTRRSQRAPFSRAVGGVAQGSPRAAQRAVTRCPAVEHRRASWCAHDDSMTISAGSSVSRKAQRHASADLRGVTCHSGQEQEDSLTIAAIPLSRAVVEDSCCQSFRSAESRLRRPPSPTPG